MKILAILMALIMVAGLSGIVGAQKVLLSGIDPYAEEYTGRLGIETIGVGDTPSILSFESHDMYDRNVIKLGGQLYTPPKVATLGLMNYDHTRPLPAATILPLELQFYLYQWTH